MNAMCGETGRRRVEGGSGAQVGMERRRWDSVF